MQLKVQSNALESEFSTRLFLPATLAHSRASWGRVSLFVKVVASISREVANESGKESVASQRSFFALLWRNETVLLTHGKLIGAALWSDRFSSQFTRNFHNFLFFFSSSRNWIIRSVSVYAGSYAMRAHFPLCVILSRPRRRRSFGREMSSFASHFASSEKNKNFFFRCSIESKSKWWQIVLIFRDFFLFLINKIIFVYFHAVVFKVSHTFHAFSLTFPVVLQLISYHWYYASLIMS